MPLLSSARPRAALLGLAILCLGAPAPEARERTPAPKSAAQATHRIAPRPAKAGAGARAEADGKAAGKAAGKAGTKPGAGSEPDATTGGLAANPEVAWSSGEAAACSRGRRKFWQAGEGWVVRTVTACR